MNHAANTPQPRIPPTTHLLRFMKFKWLYFAISVLIMLPGIFSLIRYGLRLSIDFTGGTLLEIQAQSEVSQEQFFSITKSQNLELYSIQSLGANSYILRLKPLTSEQNEAYKQSLSKVLGEITEKRFETVGPTVGAELTQKALLAVVIASVCIILYISWSFRKIPQPYTSWKFGVSAVIALVHDVIVVVGLFSLFGHFYHVEIDALFVTALLTIIGFSVHDTIVVFDRVRENLPKLPKSSFSDIVDYSLNETLVRSLNTTLTVVLTLTSLLLFGGETTRWFVTALLIGIVSGTYSSIFNASPILVLWEKSSK